MTAQREHIDIDWPARFSRLAETARSPLLRAFYGRGTPSGETPIRDVPLVALDLETTGMQADRHGIVSVGLVPFTLTRIYCAQARYHVLRPRRALSEASVAIHRITHAELRDAPDLAEILPELLKALAGRVVVVHYRGIERPFLARAVRDRLGELLCFPVIDTMALEARIHRRWTTIPAVRGLMELFGRQPASLRLAQSRARYHLPLYGAHHALTDALASAELLQAQIARHYRPETPVGDLWC
ncbi:MAG: 3'-5' exonuclease [Wenzhouxiangellaceae bacterium]|nr:3'-5' exonuclease [Wenzhouxiangellaceae bacterium]